LGQNFFLLASLAEFVPPLSKPWRRPLALRVCHQRFRQFNSLLTQRLQCSDTIQNANIPSRAENNHYFGRCVPR